MATKLVSTANKLGKKRTTKQPTKRALQKAKEAQLLLSNLPPLIRMSIPTETKAIQAAKLFLEFFSDPDMIQAIYSAKLGSQLTKVLKGMTTLVELSKKRRTFWKAGNYAVKRNGWMATYRRSGKPAAKNVCEGLTNLGNSLSTNTDFKTLISGFFGAAHSVAK